MRALFEVCSMDIALLLTGQLTIGTGGCVSFYSAPFALCLLISVDKRELADIYPGAKVVLTVSVFFQLVQSNIHEKAIQRHSANDQ